MKRFWILTSESQVNGLWSHLIEDKSPRTKLLLQQRISCGRFSVRRPRATSFTITETFETFLKAGIYRRDFRRRKGRCLWRCVYDPFGLQFMMKKSLTFFFSSTRGNIFPRNKICLKNLFALRNKFLSPQRKKWLWFENSRKNHKSEEFYSSSVHDGENCVSERQLDRITRVTFSKSENSREEIFTPFSSFFNIPWHKII